MKFKDKIIEEFGDYIYQDRHGNYAIEKDDAMNRKCSVILKNDYISCKCSNIIQERSYKNCYLVLKQGIYQKISFVEEKL